MNFGGVGRKWLDEAVEEFKALKANEEYEDGKRGVKFEISNTADTDFANVAGAGWNIYFQEYVGAILGVLFAIIAGLNPSKFIKKEQARKPVKNKGVNLYPIDAEK